MENIKIGTVWKNNRTGKMCTIIGIENGMVLYRLFPEVYGLRTYTSCTDSFIAEFTMVSEDVDKYGNNIEPGGLWYTDSHRITVVIPIKVEDGIVHFITSENRSNEVCWTMPVDDWMRTYTMFNGDKPKCYPEDAFNTLLGETMVRYCEITSKLKDDGLKTEVENMEDKSLLIEGTWWKNKESGNIGYITDIQTRKGSVIFRYPSGWVGSFPNTEFLRMFEILPSHHPKSTPESDVNDKVTDNSKLKDFESGAKREDKTGKGRYDLIPGDVMNELEDFAWETYFNNGVTTCSVTDVSKSAYFDEWDNVELYYDFIVNVICYFFAKDHIECIDECDEISYEVDWNIFRSGLYEMRKELALHYESGARVHGVDNWKKGIPVYGSERGGCFLDSMRRHIDQALQGKDDEPHAISAIWNAFGAVWTLKNLPKSSSDIKINNRDDRLEIIFPNNKKINIDIAKVELSDDKSEIVGIAKPKDEKSDD